MSQETYKPFLLKNWLAFLLYHRKIWNFRNCTDELEAEGKIFKSRKNRYGLPRHFNIVIVRLQVSERGFGFVIPDDENNDTKAVNNDIYISPDYMNGAMNNDIVCVLYYIKLSG